MPGGKFRQLPTTGTHTHLPGTVTGLEDTLVSKPGDEFESTVDLDKHCANKFERTGKKSKKVEPEVPEVAETPAEGGEAPVRKKKKKKKKVGHLHHEKKHKEKSKEPDDTGDQDEPAAE